MAPLAKKRSNPSAFKPKDKPNPKKFKPQTKGGKPLKKNSFRPAPKVVKRKNAKATTKKSVADLSESDFDSDDDLGMNGPEFGLLSDSSESSDGFDDETDVQETMEKKAEIEAVEDEESQSEEEQPEYESNPNLEDEASDEEEMATEGEDMEVKGGEVAAEEAEDSEEESAKEETENTEEPKDSDDDESSDDEVESSSDEIPEPEGSVEGDSEDEVEKPKVKKNTQDMEAESRTIFVGNLPSDVKKTKLKKWFAKFGPVESVRLRSPPVADPSVPKKVSVIQKDFHASRSNINAYIRFVKHETVEKALKANGQVWNNTHHMRVDRVTAKVEYAPKKAIFIGNLPFDAEEEQIREIFMDCGDIISVRVVRDRKTNVGKGFAYVNFAERHSVPLALAKNNSLVGKRQIRVRKFDYNGPSNEGAASKTFQMKQESFTKKMQKKNKTANADAPSFQGAEAKKKLKNKKKSLKRKLKRKQAFIEVLNSKPKKPKT